MAISSESVGKNAVSSTPNAFFPPSTLPPFYQVHSRTQLLGQFTWFVFWVAVTGFGLFLKPSPYLHGTHEELHLPPCPSVLLFNRPCPGCGLTTSFTAFLHGDFAMAFHAHPFGPILYVLFTLTALLSFGCGVAKFRFNAGWPPIQRGVTALLAVFLIFGVYRFATTPNYASPSERGLQIVSRF